MAPGGDAVSDVDSGVDSTSVPEGSPHKESQSLLSPQKEEIMTSVDRNLNSLGIQGTPKLWLGKDYCNFIAQDVINPHEAFDGRILFHFLFLFLRYVFYVWFFF